MNYAIRIPANDSLERDIAELLTRAGDVHNQFAVVPPRLEHSLENYFLHRKGMMQQIEEEDVEQQQKLHDAE